MSSSSWRKNTSVTRNITEQPYQYTFQQAVRLLERSSSYTFKEFNTEKNPVALHKSPGTECIRFHGQNSLSFPSSEIASIQKVTTDNNTKQWSMKINFMGLTGAMGVLPHHYTELLLQRLKIKDKSLLDFLDIFNHRTISLFYQASTKYNLPIEYERKKLNPPGRNTRDQHTQALLSLIGLGTEHLTNDLYTNPESMIYYGGLLTQSVRTTTGLKLIIQHHFGIPVEIKEFIGQWQELIDDVRTRLPDRNNRSGCNACLGRSSMLGKKGWFAQGRIRIILGPLSKQQLQTFSPGTSSLKALNELVRFYVGAEQDYDFIIRIKRADVPAKIKMTKKNTALLSWNTWLSSKENKNYTDTDIHDIPVSASRC